MSQVVIVAIPAKDDFVWRISSDKVPHLTLMNLGSSVSALDVPHITSYLDHVVKTSMRRFGLDVTRRGELGDQHADVLFFGDFGRKMLVDVRAWLLADPEIFKAFHSTDQFPVFTPHLTLGWPQTPAKPDPREFPGVSWVNFDKIALWTGDFEGPEYELPPDDRMAVDNMAMSGTIASFLEHHGVKGMRWGIRHLPNGTAVGKPTADAREAGASKQKIAIGGTNALTTRELQSLVTRMNLEQQYSRLAASQPTALTRGHDQVKQILGLASTAVQIFNLSQSTAAKAGFALVKSAIAKK